MTDVMRLLATVAHHQAEAAAEDLEKIADQQETNLGKKKKLRELQEFYDTVVGDESVSQGEVNKLQSWMQELEVINGGESVTTGMSKQDGVYKLGDSEDETQRNNKTAVEKNFKTKIENALKDIEDDQSLVQFQIQMATSDLQNSENVRSQAEKRLEQQRKDLTRNWAG